MRISLLMIAALLVLSSGCSMCCGPFDYDYPAFGGKHPRAVRNQGRVGSILSDPMYSIPGASADSNLEEPPEPLDMVPEDLLDTEIEDLDSDEGTSERLKQLEEKLESIQPLRNDSNTRNDTMGEENNTASSHWKPRPLRREFR